MNDSFSDRLKCLPLDLTLPSPMEVFVLNNRTLFVKRDDLIHPIISGNKWRKLMYHLHHYIENPADGILSIGGAHSNHLHALAYVCNLLGIPCTVYVYGWNQMFVTDTLRDLQNWNTQCLPISRIDAQLFRNHQDEYKTLDGKTFYIIPEGGGGKRGLMGWKDWVSEMPDGWDNKDNLLLVPCGTGTTLHGILNHTHSIQLASLKSVRQATYSFEHSNRIHWLSNPLTSSFAKPGQQVVELLRKTKSEFGLQLDPVYTGPLWYAFSEWHQLENFRIIFFLHTGGCQGSRSNKYLNDSIR